MAITLDGLTLDHVLNWSDESTIEVAIQEFVNQTTPIVNDAIWTEHEKTITIVCREEDADKSTIETSANARATVVLVEGITNWTVWIYSIETVYEGKINSTKPWKMTITLIIDD